MLVLTDLSVSKLTQIIHLINFLTANLHPFSWADEWKIRAIKWWLCDWKHSIVFFHPFSRVFSFTCRNITNHTVNTECPKLRGAALADTHLWIYFWFKLIDVDRALHPDTSTSSVLSGPMSINIPLSSVVLTKEDSSDLWLHTSDIFPSYPHLWITVNLPGKFTCSIAVKIRFILRNYTPLRLVILRLRNG